jgi:hypothetical protein
MSETRRSLQTTRLAAVLVKRAFEISLGMTNWKACWRLTHPFSSETRWGHSPSAAPVLQWPFLHGFRPLFVEIEVDMSGDDQSTESFVRLRSIYGDPSSPILSIDKRQHNQEIATLSIPSSKWAPTTSKSATTAIP